MKFNPVVLFISFIGVLMAPLGHAEMVNTISRVKPAVVIVGTHKATNSPRFNLRGTGFVMSRGNQTNSNLVVTNAHVLPQPGQEDVDAALVVQVRLDGHNLQMRLAKVIEVDKVHDLALLRLDGPAVSGLTVRDSNGVREGQAVAFMGFPIGGALGFSPVTHRAMISSITAAALPSANANQLNTQVIRSLRGEDSFDIFQLDGTAYPGNSGGPLFDPENGDVLGVLNMVFIKGTRESALSHPSGISYAIPSRFVLQLVQRYKGP